MQIMFGDSHTRYLPRYIQTCLYFTDENPVNINCKTTQLGSEYMGGMAVTVSGRTCQAWTASSPQAIGDISDFIFPDASAEDAINYCRNPDGESFGPWCYTMDPHTRFEECGIPSCGYGE